MAKFSLPRHPSPAVTSDHSSSSVEEHLAETVEKLERLILETKKLERLILETNGEYLRLSPPISDKIRVNIPLLLTHMQVFISHFPKEMHHFESVNHTKTVDSATESLNCLQLFYATPLERIELIRRGVPAAQAKRLFSDLDIAQATGLKALNLSTATVNKKAKQGENLSPEESERVVGFAKLVGQLQAMIEESGDPTGFDARAWIARWLTEPLPAFGGARPADLVDTMEGQALVSSALAKIQSGAYA